jgi:hypothetical protein
MRDGTVLIFIPFSLRKSRRRVEIKNCSRSILGGTGCQPVLFGSLPKTFRTL